jgi:hypothetical protein
MTDMKNKTKTPDLPEAGDAFAVIAHWAQVAADKCGELVYVVSPGKTEYIGVPGQGRYLSHLPRA